MPLVCCQLLPWRSRCRRSFLLHPFLYLNQTECSSWGNENGPETYSMHDLTQNSPYTGASLHGSLLTWEPPCTGASSHGSLLAREPPRTGASSHRIFSIICKYESHQLEIWYRDSRLLRKIFIFNIFTVASLLLDYFVKSRLNLSTNGRDGVLRDALRISYLGSMVKLEKDLYQQSCQTLLTEVAHKKWARNSKYCSR